MEEIEKNQGWSIYLNFLIRSHDKLNEKQMEFLREVNREVLKVTKYLKTPSDKAVESSKICLK